jgi:hypothetical protein
MRGIGYHTDKEEEGKNEDAIGPELGIGPGIPAKLDTFLCFANLRILTATHAMSPNRQNNGNNIFCLTCDNPVVSTRHLECDNSFRV